jgi:hypothetical protein
MIPTPHDSTIVALSRLISLETDPVKRAEYRLLAARSLRQLGQFAAVRQALDAAFKEAPDHPNTLRALGLEMFRAGAIAEGLTLYDKGRWQLASHSQYRRPFTAPMWQGTPLKGRRLLVWAEQGIGDQIMQARVLPKLLALGANITLEADPRLFPLLGPLRAQITCAPQTVTPDASIATQTFDLQSSLLSAWRFVADPLEGGACLTADAAKSAQYLSAWCGMGRARNIGLAWHSAATVTGAARSITPDLLHPLTVHPGLRFHSLQYGTHDLVGFGQAFGAPVLSDPSVDPLKSLEAHPAQIAALDLVITIDNATAHLAGALGVPTWVLLPKGSEWRWGSHPTKTVLYPHTRIFRASDLGQWGGALWKLFDAFARWV